MTIQIELLYEFCGTFLFIKSISMISQKPDYISIAPFAVGLSLSTSLFIFGTFSGHFNPAVTLGYAFTTHWKNKYIAYIFIQIVAGYLSFLTTHISHSILR